MQLFGAAASALAALSEQGIDACVIGGLAVASRRWMPLDSYMFSGRPVGAEGICRARKGLG